MWRHSREYPLLRAQVRTVVPERSTCVGCCRLSLLQTRSSELSAPVYSALRVEPPKFGTEGEAAFESRSRRTRTSPNELPVALEDAIVELRKFLAEEGLDAGPATIASHLGVSTGVDLTL